MSQQVRFSPSNLDCVYWLSGWVMVQRADGSEVAIDAGHHPAWSSPQTVAFCPPEDGQVQIAGPEDIGTLQLPAGNTLTANAGKVAVHRTDPRRVLTSWGLTVNGETDPVLSADGGWLATLAPDQPPGLSTVRVMEMSTGRWRSVYTGAPQRPRFSHTGTTLCWQDGAAIYGIADVANPQSPVVRLSRPEDSLSHPVPLWVPGVGLFVLYVQARPDNSGVLYLAEWGSCVAQAPLGYALVPSSGSGYDHDVKQADERYAEVALLTSQGTLWRVSADFYAAHVPLPLPPAPPVVVPPQPDPERWSFVPDGTLVTDAIRTLVGANPVQDANGIICLHKNTFPECEWRRVQPVTDNGVLFHWADASRFPGDRGWWIEPAPVWCVDRFVSGEKISVEHARLVDFHNNTTNRWRQTNTMRGIVGGGVMVQFDPRFPGQYTDMTKFGTPEWAPAGYEKQWTRHDGWAKWQYIVTPLTAKGVIPWGDPSMDIVIDDVETAPQPPSDPLPFVPCPRPLTTTPVPPQPPTEHDMTDDEIRRYTAALDDPLVFGALQRFHNEVLPRDRPADPVKTAEGGVFNTADVVTGGAFAYFVRKYVSEAIIAQGHKRTAAQASGDGYDAAIKAYTQVVNPPVQPPPVQPQTFRGPISAEGRDFVAPV